MKQTNVVGDKNSGGFTLGRIKALADGVFATSMTLLVLELKHLPEKT